MKVDTQPSKQVKALVFGGVQFLKETEEEDQKKKKKKEDCVKRQKGEVNINDKKTKTGTKISILEKGGDTWVE